LLHKLIQHLVRKPLLYEIVQIVAGVRQVDQRIHLALRKSNELSLKILDIGGGTGRIIKQVPQNYSYICIENEIEKIKILKHRSTNGFGFPVLSNAQCIPIKGGSINVILLINVCHHINPAEIRHVFYESLRVLKDGGKIIVIDPVADTKNPIRKLLWRYDQGNYPRTYKELQSIVDHYFHISKLEDFSICHRYFLCIGQKIPIQ